MKDMVTLGRTGITVNKNGFGALPVQRVSKEEAIRLVHKAYDGGVTSSMLPAGSCGRRWPAVGRARWPPWSGRASMCFGSGFRRLSAPPHGSSRTMPA